MKRLSIAVAMLLFAASALAQTAQPMPKSTAAKLLYAHKSPSKWQLTDIYDPYNGGNHISPTPPSYLTFTKKGSYTEGETGKETAGKWLISADARSLALYAPTAQPTFTHQLRTQTPDSLVLARQGRHGMVIYTYIRQKNK